jgi:hypothetical protein
MRDAEHGQMHIRHDGRRDKGRWQKKRETDDDNDDWMSRLALIRSKPAIQLVEIERVMEQERFNRIKSNDLFD